MIIYYKCFISFALIEKIFARVYLSKLFRKYLTERLLNSVESFIRKSVKIIRDQKQNWEMHATMPLPFTFVSQVEKVPKEMNRIIPVQP